MCCPNELLLQVSEKLLEAMQGSLEELDLYKSVAASTESGADPKTRNQQFRRLLLLIIAITIHNFPEGMAVGVAFGAIGSAPGATFGSAASLALGIGLQNFPVRAASPPRLAAPPRRPASPPRALTQRD